MRTSLLGAMAVLLTLVWSSYQALAGPNDAVLIITNKDYKNGADAVKFADRDGAEFERMAREVLGITDVTLLTNMTAGQFQLWFGRDGAGSDQLRKLFKSRDTTLYVFYSGHGISAIVPRDPKRQSLLLPVDTPVEAAGLLGLPISAMEAALSKMRHEQSPDGRVVLFLDTCFSGKSGDGSDLVKGSSATFDIDPARLETVTEDRLFVLSAAEYNQIAYWDSERRYGVFTDAVIEGLYGAADDPRYGGDGDKTITLGELSAFVKRHIKLRLDHLYPERDRVQTPVPAGELTAVLARFAASYPARDRLAKNREKALCISLGKNRDELQKYLAECSSGSNLCLCEEQAQTILMKIKDTEETCQAESSRLEKLVQSKDTQALAGLAEQASCPEVQKRVRQALQTIDKGSTSPEVGTPPPLPRRPRPPPLQLSFDYWPAGSIKDGDSKSMKTKWGVLYCAGGNNIGGTGGGSRPRHCEWR
jgi:hypothetical protein